MNMEVYAYNTYVIEYLHSKYVTHRTYYTHTCTAMCPLYHTHIGTHMCTTLMHTLISFPH